MNLEQLKTYVSGPATVSISSPDANVWTDLISGARHPSQSAALESARLSYEAAGGQPNHRLSDLQSLYQNL